MAKLVGASNSLLLLLFNSVTWSDIGLTDNGSQTTYTLHLHTGDPSAGTQATLQAAYTGYAGQTLTRANGTAFAVTGTQVTNVADVGFGLCTASPGADLTYVSIGDGTNIVYYGALAVPIPVTANVTTPTIVATTLVIGEV